MRFPELKKLVVKTDRPVQVEVENQEACPRYSGLTIRGVEVKDSPEWLKWRMRLLDLEPINNVVDITNYLCHGLGQPMHAFDAGKIEGNKVVVKTLSSQTVFKTLDEKERKLHEDDLMICDAKKGMCVAGVFGGFNSGITESTKDLFLESAYFSPESIRNTVQRHGLTTDASFRYERGADPEMTVDALTYAAQLIVETCGGTVSSDIIDVYAKPEEAKIPTTYRNFKRLIGKDLPHDKIIGILESLDIQCVDKKEEGFTAVVPLYRNDVTREADLVEEVLRIYGFNNIELDEHASASYLAEFAENEPYVIRRKISEYMAGKGFHEILTNSLVHPDYEQKCKVNDREAVEIINKSSEELAYMKTSPVHSGLEVVRHNINRRMPNVRLFEWAKTYHKEGGQYLENAYLCLYLTGDVEEENWMRETKGVLFQDLMGAVQSALTGVRIHGLEHAMLTEDRLYSAGLELKLNGAHLGRIGWLKTDLLRYFDIKQPVAYAELEWKRIMRNVGKPFVFEELPKFPEVRRDLSLVVDKSISFDRIEEIAFKSAKKLLTRVNVFSVYEGEKIEAGKKSYAVSYYLQDKTKTLNDQLIERVMSDLIGDYEKELGAVIRK